MSGTSPIVTRFEAAPLARLEDAPDILLRIHRGKDAYVGFVRKPRELVLDKNGKPLGFQNLFSLKVSELQGMFPTVRDWLAEDSYFTINSPFRAAPWTNKWTGLPDVWRKEPNPATKFKGHFRYLNACYCDIDCGREEDPDPSKSMSWRMAAAVAGEMMDKGELPQASIFAKSGRGLYIFWLLVNERDPSQPPPAFHERIAVYKTINKALGQRLMTRLLAVDTAAHDAARVLRLHGSVHTKTGTPAQYLIQAGPNLRPYTYSLRQLTDFCGIRLLEPSLPEHTRTLAAPAVEALILERSPPKIYGREVKDRGSAPNRRAGHIKRNAYRAQDVATLAQHAGGWSHGMRRRSLRFYAQFLHGAGQNREEVLEAVSIMAAGCQPPYPSDPNDPKISELVDEAVAKPRIYQNETLLRFFKITPEIARELRLLTIIPPEVKAEREPGPGGHRGESRTLRRERIRQLVAERRNLTCREIERILEAEGIPTNRQTVNEDMNALGYKVAPRGRPSLSAHPALPLKEAQ